MKKYFLKGKQFLSKKLEQFEIQTQSIDYVNQQIPNKLQQPLKVLQKNIDLDDSQKYETYFKNYPTHHLSQFLLQKYSLLVGANSPSPNAYLPKSQIEGVQQLFVPKFDAQLQNKALLLKQVVQEYQQGYHKANEAIICMSVIHFHHKRGAQIEYSYPKNKTVQSIEGLIIHHSMPDSSHNKNQDYNFFNFQTIIKGKKRMLFGVSYFKQIKLTEQHKQKNKELTRSYLQKALCVVSYLPLFGYLKLRLASTVKIFFNDFNNFDIVNQAYKDLEKHLTSTWPQMSINQLYIGSDLKTIINLFGPSDFYEIWKAVLYQKRIVVFAHSSSSASSFIISLISLFPGLNTFGIYSKQISKYMQSLRQYALPLKLFSAQNFMSMSFHIQDFHLLAPFQKNKNGSFLVGTTNRLLKQNNDYGVQLLINLQNCSLQKKKGSNWQNLSKREKSFVHQLEQIIQRQKNIGYSGSQDCIRNLFHNFLKDSLLQMIIAIKDFKVFVSQCQKYESQNQKSNHKNNTKKQGEVYQLNEEDDCTQQTFSNKKKQQGDFPPLIPSTVTSIPFASLLQQKSFQFFLQFHNQRLPKLLKAEIIPGLIIDNYKYYLLLQNNQFVLYDWSQKKLQFGKGNPKNYEGKQIRFYKQNHQEQTNQIKSVFVGIIQNGKFNKNGFFLDKTQIYQGDFYNGMKEGYGKLTNTLHKYIGNFQQDLYSGQGQLVFNKDIYVGEFKQGLRHGCGKNQSQGDGLNYDGQWINDKPQGNGIMKMSQHQIIGVFKNGRIDQEIQVTLRYQDGRMYKGFIKNGTPEGRGFIVDGQGKLTSGIFINGILKSNSQNQVQNGSIKQEKPSEQTKKQKIQKDSYQQNQTIESQNKQIKEDK